jgi:4-hydroxy-2-oxoheptanedioate aldolase
MVDLEHGGMSDGEMHTAIHSIAPFGVSPIVRLPSSEGWLIKRALDAGAHGIAIPMVSTPVSGRYPPVPIEITILPSDRADHSPVYP